MKNNKKNNDLSSFTNLYSLSKTLRFELIPIGKTKENIEKSGILSQDNHRAESYKSAKKLIDFYHKHYIDSHLREFAKNVRSDNEKNVRSDNDLREKVCSSLKTCAALMGKTDEAMKKKYSSAQDLLRKEIAKALAKDKKDLFSEKLIKEDLMNYLNKAAMDGVVLPDGMTIDECKSIVNEFQGFATYFSGFNQNRENMYSEEAKSTGIAFRLVHDNLPKFMANMLSFKKVAEPLSENIAQLEKDLGDLLQKKKISDFFELPTAYLDCLTQSGITIYNTILGGRSENEGGKKIKGLNEYVNLYNQKHKKQRLPKFVGLYKMILSDRESLSWLPEQFEDDQTLLETIEQTWQSLNSLFNDDTDDHPSLKNLLLNIDTYDLKGIFIANDLSLTSILKSYYGNWNVLRRALEIQFEKNNPRKKNKTAEKYEERRDKFVKKFDSFSLDDINHYVEDEKLIEDYFVSMGSNEKEAKTLFEKATEAYEEVKDILNTTPTAKLTSDSCVKQVEKIKNLLDALKDIQHFVQPLRGKGNEGGRDARFYADFEKIWAELDQITPLYNKVRNYLTQRPYSEKKIKLNFENKGNFLGGWVDSKTENSDNGTQYGGYLFRRKNGINEYDYFIGVSANVKLFRNTTSVSENDKSQYERLDYYQLKSQTIYGSSYIGDYAKESRAIINAIDDFVHQNGNAKIKAQIEADRAKKTPKTSTAIGYLTFVKEKDIVRFNDLLKDSGFQYSNRKMITSLKGTLALLARVKNAQKLAEKQYELFSDIMNEIDDLVKEKVFDYFPISQTELERALNSEEKTLFLFKITNKDLSYAEKFLEGKRLSRGTENLHTLYFKALMEGNQSVFDIGTGAIFFRKGSISYSDEVMQKGHHADELKGKFMYPIIKDKRFTADKFQLHLSIVQNYKSPKTNNINPQVNEFIKAGGVKHIIGIDRGERHLLYLSLIDLKGNIVKQFTLNQIVNEYRDRAINEIKTKTTDYHKLLNIKEKERDEARKSWKTVENIKELKEGYLSQVIHKICEMMIEYNAIVVLEDLNCGFMRGRQKVEKQVYQKFEKMLIDKLNYLVDKKQKSDLPGGTLNAYQLTNKFESFQKKVGKQTGFLFYISAWNTSKIDPVTGFVNLFDTRYESVEKTKSFFKNFKEIKYNEKKKYFEFVVDDYTKFSGKAEGTKKDWTICTYGTRIETFRNPDKNNEWDSKEVKLTEEFKTLFKKYTINVKNTLKESILSQTEKDFFENLLKLFRLTLQMRNSITGKETDYLISPVAKKGKFYDSKVEKVKGKDRKGDWKSNLPVDADANGAYNIARKGLWVIEQIKAADDLSQLKLAISNKEWLRYAQGVK